jgi:hypothetical protein
MSRGADYVRNFQNGAVVMVFGGHFEAWLPWQRPPFCSTPKICHTLWWIFLQIFMKFDEKDKKKTLYIDQNNKCDGHS